MAIAQPPTMQSMKMQKPKLNKLDNDMSSSPTKKAPRIFPAAALLHDKANLYVLPFLGLAALAGILGLLDGMITTYMLTAYIILDLLWIVLQPEAVPSLPGIICFHHVVTLVLLAYPLKYPHFATYCNWDGLVELNTFFLIARRQVKQMRSIMNTLFWVTFIPTRFMIHPYLVLQFWQVTEGYPMYERIPLVSAQMILCAFNFLFLYRAMPNKVRDRLHAYVG